jgi:hypothetical protein
VKSTRLATQRIKRAASPLVALDDFLRPTTYALG